MSLKSGLTLLILALVLDDQVHTGFIYGGREAEPHSRPYMALVQGHEGKSKVHDCGGFLLSEDFVMTAAHCQAKSYSVLLGVHEIKNITNVQNISVEQAFPHENYKADDYSNDMMILKLSSKAQFNNNVQPIRLPNASDGSLPKSCSIAGWGRSDKYPNSMTGVLMEVNVTLIKNGQRYKDHSYCSEGENRPGMGDSGGPLVCDGKAYGVVSSVGTLPDGRQISCYIKIPDYNKWIDLMYKKAAQLKFS